MLGRRRVNSRNSTSGTSTRVRRIEASRAAIRRASARAPQQRDAWALLAIVLAVLIVPMTGSRLLVYNLTIIAIYATVVIGLNLITGYAGQVSFAQPTFMAIGGYSSALLSLNLGWNSWVALLAGTVVSALTAVVIGAPLLRLRGHNLAMATFALALGTVSLLLGAVDITAGVIGIAAIPPLEIGAFSLSEPLTFYALAWLVCGFAVLSAASLVHSYIGRAWRALATNQEVAASLAIDVAGYKLLALVVASVMASIGGSLYAEFSTFVNPEVYGVPIIINLFIMLTIGGRGSIAGPILGTAIVVLAPQLISGLQDYQYLVFYVLLLVLIVVRPRGIMGRDEDVPLSTILPAWLLLRRRARPEVEP